MSLFPQNHKEVKSAVDTTLDSNEKQEFMSLLKSIEETSYKSK